MDFNRNQYLFTGVLIVLIGLQVRAISSFELTNETSRMLAKEAPVAVEQRPFAFASTQQSVVPPLRRRVVTPPEWLGWCLLSVGVVLVLHSLAMKKPGG